MKISKKYFRIIHYEEILLLCIVMSCMFNFIPKILHIKFLGSVISSKLTLYPLLIFYFIAYINFKNKKMLKNLTDISTYFVIYISVQILPLLFSINNFYKNHLYYYFICWSIKEIVLNYTWTFGATYLIYCFYYSQWKKCLNVLLNGIIISLIFIFTYNIFEISYLLGSTFAKNLLITINPYIHVINYGYGWWPPLLLPGQLRSLFAEPSYYGIYFAFAMPFLWCIFVNAKKIHYKIILILSILFFSFCLFLTQARTAVALFCGEIFILFIFMIYLRNKFFFKQVGKIFIASITAFMFSGLFINNLLVDNRYGIDSIESYLESNLTSLASTSQRSNGARYSIMIADLKIGLDHPLIGVGTGLRNAYILDYLPEMAKDNGEVQMWIQNQKEKGILRSGFPKLGEYTSRFAETGIIGLVLFLIPPFILLRKLYFKITYKNMTVDDKLPYVFFTISLIGIMASGLGDTINITYCYWVLLGLGYAMCFGKENDVKDNGDTGSRQEH